MLARNLYGINMDAACAAARERVHAKVDALAQFHKLDLEVMASVAVITLNRRMGQRTRRTMERFEAARVEGACQP